MKLISEVKKNTVYDYLYSAIRKGEIKAGDTLTERDLAEKLGVSRTPIREAIRKLEEQGVVIHEPHKGAKVIALSAEKAAELYEVRELLEGLAARKLAQIHTAEMMEELTGYIERAEKKALAKEIEKLSDINSAFHLALARLSGNIYLEVIMNMLQTQINLLMTTSLSYSGRPLENIEEHKQILEAIKLGDGDFAESVAKYHVRQAKIHAMKKIAEGGM
ncbi:GntR family transcriptional regulator [Planococcus soli]|uniref:GntR family transcriptional regulator n=1 Tax=Planococcus soli TaxID=2666072 RepID=UPI00115D83C8|nr:GntR family transcriptional regulator [Planococcus soli]